MFLFVMFRTTMGSTLFPASLVQVTCGGKRSERDAHLPPSSAEVKNSLYTLMT
jgi:hypothetical protein